MLEAIRNFFRKLTHRKPKSEMLTPQCAAARMKALAAEGFTAGNFVCNDCGDTSVSFVNGYIDCTGSQCDECGSYNTEWEFLDDEDVQEIIVAIQEE